MKRLLLIMFMALCLTSFVNAKQFAIKVDLLDNRVDPTTELNKWLDKGCKLISITTIEESPCIGARTKYLLVVFEHISL